MPCQFLGSLSPIERRWHLFRCPECRAARAADAVLTRGIERLNAEPVPAEGLASTLAAVGVVSRVRSARKTRWRATLRYRLLPAGVLTAAVTVAAAGWLIYMDLDPKITIPPPAAPSPNAYNLLRDAANSIPVADRVQRLQPSGSMTYTESRIKAALASVPGTELPARRNPDDPYTNGVDRQPDHFYTLKEKEALLREYDTSLSLLRQGFAYSYQAPPVRSFDADYSYESADLHLAHLLVLDAQVKEEHGDLAGAANSSLDAIELETQVAHGTALAGRVKVLECGAMGRASLWPLLDRLNGVQARAAAQRLERIIARDAPFADTLQEEKWVALTALKEMFHDRQWRTDLWPPTLTDQSDGLLKYLVLLPYSKTRIVDDYTRVIDDGIADARAPYSATEVTNNFPAAAARNLVPAIYFPDYVHIHFAIVAGHETQNALLLTALALRAYEQEHHAYPKRLQQLVPRYLASVPVDPFGNGQPIRYRPDGPKNLSPDGLQHGYQAIYSVGPDARDDGGTAIGYMAASQLAGRRPTHMAALGSGEYTIAPSSNGDIVAGINMQ